MGRESERVRELAEGRRETSGSSPRQCSLRLPPGQGGSKGERGGRKSRSQLQWSLNNSLCPFRADGDRPPSLKPLPHSTRSFAQARPSRAARQVLGARGPANPLPLGPSLEAYIFRFRPISKPNPLMLSSSSSFTRSLFVIEGALVQTLVASHHTHSVQLFFGLFPSSYTHSLTLSLSISRHSHARLKSVCVVCLACVLCVQSLLYLSRLHLPSIGISFLPPVSWFRPSIIHHSPHHQAATSLVSHHLGSRIGSARSLHLRRPTRTPAPPQLELKQPAHALRTDDTTTPERFRVSQADSIHLFNHF